MWIIGGMWFGKFAVVDMHLFDAVTLLREYPVQVFGVYMPFSGGGPLFTNTYYIAFWWVGGWCFGNRHGISRLVSGSRTSFIFL